MINKPKIVQAYPQVSMITDICILGDKEHIPIGGFGIAGGFYLREGFALIKEKTKNVVGEKITYFNFVKLPIKGKIEKIILKHKRKKMRKCKK